MDSTSIKTWTFINSFAPWLSAIGTLIVALFTYLLIRKEKTIKLKASAAITYSYGYNVQVPQLVVTATNIGIRVATVKNLGILIDGLTFQPESHWLRSNKNVLNDGKSVEYEIDVSAFENIIKHFKEKKIKSIKVFTKASTGEMFSSKISKNILNVLYAEINKPKPDVDKITTSPY